mgnify:CR=1 FL=1
MVGILIKKLDPSNSKDIQVVTKMLYEWWGKDVGFQIDTFEELIKARASLSKKIPITLVAKCNNEIVGTISLIVNNIDLRQDIYPIITSFFVKEGYRNKGIGKELLEKIINIARENFASIYLMTSIEGFYEKLGFKYIETTPSYINYRTNKISIDRLYKIDL